MLGVITAFEFKRWLFRHISTFAGEHELHYGLSAEGLEKLANHVRDLPDDDERFAELAAAYPDDWSFDQLPVGGDLTLTHYKLEDDPDEVVSQYVETELAALRLR